MDPKSKMIRDIRELYGFEDEEVLSAMGKVPRHEFADVQKAAAYSDSPISIGHGQTMSQPYTVAYMTHLLISSIASFSSRKEKKTTIKDWRVLEIGTGSGYQAAVLAELVDEVYTVEIVPELADKAKKKLKSLGYKNVHVKKGSGEYGWKKHAPYDGIMITAALEKDVPDKLVEQLKVRGVIVTPIGKGGNQIMTRLKKVDKGKLEREEFERFVFVPFVKE
jgi:protein-L-isoaspartate(D-aspartate) O-methyltransferase